jgi:hypothetical protein
VKRVTEEKNGKTKRVGFIKKQRDAGVYLVSVQGLVNVNGSKRTW